MIDQTARSEQIGVLLAIGSYLMWGLSGLYFVLIAWVPPEEVIAHRIIWTALLLAPALLIKGRVDMVKAIFANRRTRWLLVLSSILMAMPWYLFVWAITNGVALDASMGFFLLPLVVVLLASVLLRERLNPRQCLAVGLAAIGVVYLIWARGTPPWLALGCAVTFGLYSLLRKKLSLDPLIGLLLETALLTPLALLYILVIEWTGPGTTFLHTDPMLMLLILGTGPFTAGTLLLFTAAARRIRLTTLGILQYLNPSCQLLVAIFIFGEPFDHIQFVTFLFIWSGLLLYSCDVPALVGWWQARASR